MPATSTCRTSGCSKSSGSNRSASIAARPDRTPVVVWEAAMAGITPWLAAVTKMNPATARIPGLFIGRLSSAGGWRRSDWRGSGNAGPRHVRLLRIRPGVDLWS